MSFVIHEIKVLSWQTFSKIYVHGEGSLGDTLPWIICCCVFFNQSLTPPLTPITHTHTHARMHAHTHTHTHELTHGWHYCKKLFIQIMKVTRRQFSLKNVFSLESFTSSKATKALSYSVSYAVVTNITIMRNVLREAGYSK